MIVMKRLAVVYCFCSDVDGGDGDGGGDGSGDDYVKMMTSNVKEKYSVVIRRHLQPFPPRSRFSHPLSNKSV